MKINEARRFFFSEETDARDVFANKNWRGAVLDRDKYGWHRMPAILWKSIQRVSTDSNWWICGYGSVGEIEPDAVPFTLDWDSFPNLPRNPAGTSSEWIAYNASRTIAVLAEFDVTIVGAHEGDADRIDAALSESGTSLRQLTIDDMGDETGWGYITSLIRSVIK